MYFVYFFVDDVVSVHNRPGKGDAVEGVLRVTQQAVEPGAKCDVLYDCLFILNLCLTRLPLDGLLYGFSSTAFD